MKTNNQYGKLMLPCLRGYMGDWIYYVSLLKFKDISLRIKSAHEIHKHKGLNELLQRELTNRANLISDYLCNQKQHFFNAIIAGMYDGEPTWCPISVEGNARIPQKDIPELITSSVGVLELSGDEKIFAIDGQHRVEGIRRSLLTDKKLEDDEQTVIFVAHRNTKTGLQRTRRLFSTLNRYAKPVTLGEIIAIDEDDIFAISTRYLLERHPFLSQEHIIYTGKTKVVPRNNATCLTSVQCLYEVLEIIFFPNNIKNKKNYKSLRPSDKDLELFYKEASDFWNIMIKEFPPLHKLMTESASKNIAGKYRGEHGGHLLFRPVGLLSLAKAIRQLMDKGCKLEKIILRLSEIELQLDKSPWAGLLWESGSQKMIYNKKNQTIASNLVIYMLGANIKAFGFSKTTLLDEYSAALNREPHEVKLPSMIVASKRLHVNQ